jgi:hypothetical protein
MKLTPRDRRALLLLGAGVALVALLRFVVFIDGSAQAPRAAASIPLAETRLARLRQVAASLPAREEVLKQAVADVAVREKGIVVAETAPQAQARLLQIVRQAGKTEGIDVRGGEMGPVRKFGDDYAEVGAAVSFDCRIEQLVNLLAAIANESHLVATQSLRVNSANAKEKTVNVRLELAGVVPRALAPDKKGPSL